MFFAFSKAKKGFKKCEKCCNLQGIGALTGKKTAWIPAFQRPKVAKHCYLQCFVLSTFSWNCKNCVNTIKYQHFLRSTRQKWCNLHCFFALLSKTLIFAVFCACLVENVLVFTAFSAFLHGSRKRRQNAKNAVIYSILWLSKSDKSSEKCVQTALFSDFRYPQNRGGGIMLLETLMSDPDSVQKALPHPPEGFLVFFGARRRRVGGTSP